MYCGQDWPVMNPDETRDLSLNFQNDGFNIAGGEKITGTPTWTCAVETGTDASPGSRLIGAPAVDATGLITTQRVSGLLDGVTYRLRALVTTTAGQLLALHSYQVCKVAAGTDS